MTTDIKKKRQRFNALLAAGQMMEAKPYILAGFGVDSTSELTEKQLDDVIARVERIINKKNIDVPRDIREWRHKCLRMIQKCGVNTQDWNAVNAFMADPRICGRMLYELNLQELIILHRKLHNVAINIQSKKTEISRLTQQN